MFAKTVSTLEEAKDVIDVYFRSMTPGDRHDWWNDAKEHPYQKLYEMVKELMPDYDIQYYADHQEGDEDLIPDVINGIMKDVKYKFVDDFQMEDFWFDEVGHERLYFTAIKTVHADNLLKSSVQSK
ncbi:MAG: hypothetical protein J5691_01035 [Bacilli bacterium]|nr:hypothetical protein [Bacilli bacterium]